ncbi:hypothetical protein D3C78_1579920 [compost metagenome]
MHLLSVHAGWKDSRIGKRPVGMHIVRAVTLVELKAGYPPVHERLQMMLRENLSCLLNG